MKRILLFFVLATGLLPVHAQTRSLSGVVLNADGSEPLIGVSVLIKGKTTGVSTNADGKFTLQLPDQQPTTLIARYIGFKPLEVTVAANQSTIQIRLVPESTALSEVVVVGYGQVNKRDLTGSVVSVKGEELVKVPATSVMESIQGKVPGVDITRSSGASGAGTSVTIRGNRSIAAGNGPLYIVDGIQGVSINDINPNDIQSLDVLKDASSTAIYGSRGANGVIIITTKRGTSDKPRFSFNSYAGVSQVAGYPEVMSGPQYVALKREANKTTGKWTSEANDKDIFNAAELAAIQNNQYINYADELIHDGFQQDYQLGVSGGSDKTKVYFSGGLFDEKGLFKLDRYKRYSGRLNIDQSVNNWLKVGMQTQLIYTDRDVRRDPLNQGNKNIPIGTLYDASGALIIYPNGNTQINALVDEQPGVYVNNSLATRGLLSGYLELNPIKALTVRSVFAANFTNTDANYYAAKNTIDRATSSGSLASITPSQNRNISWENILTYKTDIKRHSLALTGVTSYLSTTNTGSSSEGQNQLFGSQLYYSLGSAQSPVISSSYSAEKLISFTGRVNYSFAGKYLLTLTGRSDGSSKLGPGNKWAFFPSAALGWRISDESFMQKQKIFSNIKLRVSYGVTGNDAIRPYQTQSGLTRYPFTWDDNNAAPAYTIASAVGNRNLKWELTASTDVGIDFGILNNRVSAVIDYYDSKTSDLLLNRALPSSTGVTTVTQNVGKTRNRGIEIGVTTNNLVGKVKWTTGLSFFSNKEEIVELAYGAQDDIGNRWFIGKPVNVFFDYEKIGIWQANEAAEAATYGAYVPGDIRVKDQNGDGKISSTTGIDDRIVLGSSVPKWSGGLNNDLSYKGFDLNFYFFARVGQALNSDYYGKYHPQAIENSAQVNYWTPENPTGTYPRPNANRAPASTPFISTLSFSEASYVKLRNVALGYTFPANMLTKFKVSSLRIYVTGKNLATFSNIKEFDPEGNGSGSNPLTRLYVAGINLGF